MLLLQTLCQGAFAGIWDVVWVATPPGNPLGIRPRFRVQSPPQTSSSYPWNRDVESFYCLGAAIFVVGCLEVQIRLHLGEEKTQRDTNLQFSLIEQKEVFAVGQYLEV